MSRKTKGTAWLAGIALVCSLAVVPAKATNSLGATFSGGAGYRSWGLNGGLNLDDAATWEGDFSAARTVVTNTDLGTDYSNQFQLLIDHAPDDAWDLDAGLNYSTDLTNHFYSFGPNVDINYTWNTTDSSAGGSDSDDSDQGSDDTSEVLGVKVSGEILGYTVQEAGKATTFTNRFGQKVTLTSANKNVSVTQFNPALKVEMPFFDSYLIPSASGGVYLYSNDNVTEIANYLSARFPGNLATSRLNAMVGNFLTREWALGLESDLPWNITLKGDLGGEQEVTPAVWVQTYDADIEDTFFGHWDTDLGWSYSLQQGTPQSLVSLSETYKF